MRCYEDSNFMNKSYSLEYLTANFPFDKNRYLQIRCDESSDYVAQTWSTEKLINHVSFLDYQITGFPHSYIMSDDTGLPDYLLQNKKYYFSYFT